MSSLVLTTKLFVPVPKTDSVSRPRLVELLNRGSKGRLTLISAAAGAGKTSLLAEWVAQCSQPVAWISLDEEHRDPIRFLVYLVSVLRAVFPDVGGGVLAGLMSPFPPAVPGLVTSLVNDLANVEKSVFLVLDDYHRIDALAIDEILGFLVEHLPPQLTIVIATREDPPLPLARMRALGVLTEIRMHDLKFTTTEATAFFGRMVGSRLSEEAILTLASRTEGWAAGLRLAALSLLHSSDTEEFLASFAGSHRFVLDYLIEEVLKKQPEDIQTFLLSTSILERLSGPLCDALLNRTDSQETLANLELANLFLVPLDQERQWYRYHQLFGDMLRRLLERSLNEVELHRRAGHWLEQNGCDAEAFRQAAACNDYESAERLIESGKISSHWQGAVADILDWLATVPRAVLDKRPVLWVRRATLLLAAGQTAQVEGYLVAAEKALEGLGQVQADLRGQMATARATVAVTRYDVTRMVEQADRALAQLHPENVPYRFMALSALGFAQLHQGDRSAAARSYQDALTLSRLSNDAFSSIMALTNVGQVEELQNKLPRAAESYSRVLEIFADHPQPYACEATLGLARIHAEWNELEVAERLGLQALKLARQYDQAIDRFVMCELFLAQLWGSQGQIDRAQAQLSETALALDARGFAHRRPEWAAVQIRLSLSKGDVKTARELAEKYQLHTGQARVALASGDATSAAEWLEKARFEAEGRRWVDEIMRANILLAVALQHAGQQRRALEVLNDALEAAEPGRIIRSFVVEGPALQALLRLAARESGWASRIVAGFDGSGDTTQETLSTRELEVLGLIARGLSNQSIGNKLFLALDTVKGHNRRIFEKLMVHSRTEAVARARERGLL